MAVTDKIRNRVAGKYGAGVAAALVRRGDGWILETQAGRVIFRPSRTRFRRANPGELSVGLASPGASKSGTSLIVHAGSDVEDQLVRRRIRSGINKPTVVRSGLYDSASKKKAGGVVSKKKSNSAGRKRRSKRERMVLPDPLERLKTLLRRAGFKATFEDGRPFIENFPARFRRVPGYGILLEDGGRDLHFRPLETLVYKPSSAERRILDGAPRRLGACVLRPGGSEEQQIVERRLREIATRRRDALQATSDAALATPLGHELEVHLQAWTRPPYNLLLLENGAISIRKGAGRIGVLHSDRLTVGSESISGDFLTASAPWQEANALLERAVTPPPDSVRGTEGEVAERSSASRPSGWRPKSAPLPVARHQPTQVAPARSGQRPAGRSQGDSRHRIEQPPAGLPEELIELVLQASREIRLERNAVFPRPVELRNARFSLRFDPIEGETPRLLVPFEFNRGYVSSSSGYIWLWTPDPLTLVFTVPPAAEDEALVWAATLLGFADLTVWPDQRQPSRALQPKGQRSHRATSATRSKQLHHRRTMPVLEARPRGLEIEELRAHMVVAHKRWLPDGWEASAEKVNEASALGIDLEAGQTWVSAHTRGGAVGVQRVVGVDWHPPQLLAVLF